MKEQCASCKYFFTFDNPPALYPSEYKICNHPSVGGKGLSPLKKPTDTCKKWSAIKSKESKTE